MECFFHRDWHRHMQLTITCLKLALQLLQGYVPWLRQAVSLSLTAMLMPTNDAIVGLDSFTVPDATGSYVFFLNAYDVGTFDNPVIRIRITRVEG